MPVATPFLMFQGDAEAAIRFYVATIPGSALTKLELWPAGGPVAEGKVLMGEFTIAGTPFRANDSNPGQHDFTFTPSSSVFVDFDGEGELDAAYAALEAGGRTLMPLGDYGFSQKFGWVEDRFGVSWQLNLPA